MNCRRHGRKPTIALWMLVAAVDVAILAAAAGPVITVMIAAALLTLVGGVKAVQAQRTAQRPAEVVVRRRA